MIIIMIIIVPETQETRSKVLDPTCKKSIIASTTQGWFGSLTQSWQTKLSSQTYPTYSPHSRPIVRAD